MENAISALCLGRSGLWELQTLTGIDSRITCSGIALNLGGTVLI